MEKDGGPAFARPCGEGAQQFSTSQKGMSLHQWYAGMALQGILSNRRIKPTEYMASSAVDALRAADAMIAAYAEREGA